jgi:hypothetical protein
MKNHLKSILAFSIITLGTLTAHAGEQRLVGYANGKPLYVSGGPIVRAALPATQPMPVRTYAQAPARVNVGSSQCYHGPVATYAGNAGAAYGWGAGAYGGGYYDSSMAYGAYGNNAYGNNACRQLQVPCRPAACPPAYMNPYPAAAARGYSWIPRYGASTHIPQYP